MSLKYRIIKELNPEYVKEVSKVKSLTEELLMHKDYMSKLKKKHLTDSGVNEEVKHQIKKAKKKLNDLMPIKEVKKIEVKSENKWRFFNEHVDEECGLTRYDKDNAVEVTASGVYDYVGGKDTVKTVKEIKEKALKRVKDMRAARKKVASTVKQFTVPGLPIKVTYEVFASGGNGLGNDNFNLHIVPGEILRLQDATKLKRVFEPKKPTTSENHVSIEIEFVSVSDRYTIGKMLIDKKLDPYVNLTTDGSLRPDGEYKQCHELTVMMPESKAKQILRDVIDVLDAAKCKVNSKCGLHVHLDVRNRNKETVFNNLVKSQSILYGMNPVQRLTGLTAEGDTETVYSRKVNYSDFEEAIRYSRDEGNERYMGINPHAFGRHQTIEVRIHSGSTNFDKIFNWVCILVNIASDENKYKTETATIADFCERFNLNKVLEEYIESRTKHFRDKSGKHITINEAS